MSEVEVLVSSGEASESGEDILSELPSWMPRGESSGNFKLLDVAGRGLDRLKEDVGDADKATNVQTAESVGQLRELAKLVDLSSKSDESVEKYRKRIIGEFQNATAEGDLPGLLKNTSILLSIDQDDIEYVKGTENGAFILSVPSTSITNSAITKSEFQNLISKQSAAGYRPNIQTRGTFTYITPNQYSNNDHDATRGYDGLDANGDPKDNGGTYAGVLN